ncbi:RNA polymerase sigma factor [Rhodohalobacter sp. 614A]|uniref:RNA polymerase sigma factor n=1 Tax=Rhodohalobacter sp. 614A TaxID=2908649 RepID=UPI001F45EA68|nr:RNA polymerase sigma-70 factor [Rhodohalobacter sp. 614A]
MSRTSNSESLLIEKIQEGDEYAFEIVFLKYHEPLCRYIWKFVRSRVLAEGIVQEVFTDVWNDRENLNSSGHLRGLLYEMARNKALDHIKHQKIVDQYIIEAKQKIEEDLQLSIQEEGKYDSRIFHQSLQKAVEELPPKGRQIFELNRNEGLTYLEISEYLDISVKTVETHMRRVFQKLREHLSKYVSILCIGVILGLFPFL